jgi:hypothetical protein
MSPLRAESPSNPERSFSQRSTSATDTPSARDRCPTIAGSMSPERVPITSPSSGVRPIEVSTDRPFSIATAEEPFPRCSATRVAADSRVPVSGAVALEHGSIRDPMESESTDAVAIRQLPGIA